MRNFQSVQNWSTDGLHREFWFPSRITTWLGACSLHLWCGNRASRKGMWLALVQMRGRDAKPLEGAYGVGKLLSILVTCFLVEAARRQYVFVPNLEEMRYWLFYPSFQGPFPCGDLHSGTIIMWRWDLIFSFWNMVNCILGWPCL